MNAGGIPVPAKFRGGIVEGFLERLSKIIDGWIFDDFFVEILGKKIWKKC